MPARAWSARPSCASAARARVSSAAERDLVEHALGDDVPAGILRQVRGARRASTSPASGSSSPAAICASVVLPAPFGPVSATTSPRRTSSDAPSSTTRSP